MEKNENKKEEDWFLDSNSEKKGKVGYIFLFIFFIITVLQTIASLEHLSQLDNSIRHHEILKEKRQTTKKHLKEVGSDKESSWRKKQFEQDLAEYEKKLPGVEQQKEEITLRSTGALLGILFWWFLCLFTWSKVRKHRPELSPKGKKAGLFILVLGGLGVLICAILLATSYPRVSIEEAFLGIIPSTLISFTGFGLCINKIK